MLAKAIVRRQLRVAAFVVALTVAAGGCGGEADSGDEDAERSVAATLADLRTAFREGDVDGLCERMTRSAQHQAGTAAHGRPTGCVRDVRELLKTIDGGGGWIDGRAPRAGAVRVEGSRAAATVRDDGAPLDVPFRREGGRWRLDSFFGTPAALAAPTRRGPPTGGVEVSGGGGARCPRLYESGYPGIGGGCQLLFADRRVDIAVGTPFGRFRFATCWIAIQLAVGADGRAWVVDTVVEGESGTGCGDVRPCQRPGSALALPWPGRIARTAAGDVDLRLATCFQTCVGYFEGDLDMRLVRGQRGWRAVLDDAAVGRSGLTFDGALASGPALGVREAS